MELGFLAFFVIGLLQLGCRHRSLLGEKKQMASVQILKPRTSIAQLAWFERIFWGCNRLAADFNRLGLEWVFRGSKRGSYWQFPSRFREFFGR
jgi:hypothetical protein